jgi:hypothetical protein
VAGLWSFCFVVAVNIVFAPSANPKLGRHFAGLELGLFGFVLALAAAEGRKTGVGLALFGFVWVCFCARKSGVFSVSLCKKRG